jgi:hypothetical protein
MITFIARAGLRGARVAVSRRWWMLLWTSARARDSGRYGIFLRTDSLTRSSLRIDLFSWKGFTLCFSETFFSYLLYFSIVHRMRRFGILSLSTAVQFNYICALQRVPKNCGREKTRFYLISWFLQRYKGWEAKASIFVTSYSVSGCLSRVCGQQFFLQHSGQ